MTFEAWLWQRYNENSDNLVDRFARKFMVGPIARHWQPHIETREQLEQFIKDQADLFDSEEIIQSYLFAARAAWADYEKEKVNFC